MFRRARVRARHLRLELSWSGKVFASVYGDRPFVRSVLEGLVVETFSPPPA
jgi:hypothetical protein